MFDPYIGGPLGLAAPQTPLLLWGLRLPDPLPFQGAAPRGPLQLDSIQTSFGHYLDTI